jgi:5'-3' exonuclease
MAMDIFPWPFAARVGWRAATLSPDHLFFAASSLPRLISRRMLYLVDASVFIFRSWHAVPIDVVDGDGNPVNAVLGFARFLCELLERESPRHVAVAFDESLEQGYRNEIYPAYKANRDPAPVELKRQFALCREVCKALGVAQFGSSRYEADDIIGTLATRARAINIPVTIVSRDKDLTQLVSTADWYWDAIADLRYGYGQIEKRFGVIPERMADFLALTGDAVDNIPGVPGIGRKTAQKLLEHFDSLAGVFAHLADIPKLRFRNAGFVASCLAEHREAALLSRQLTGIACDMPLPVSRVGDLRRHAPDLAMLETFCNANGFGRVLREQGRRLYARHVAG